MTGDRLVEPEQSLPVLFTKAHQRIGRFDQRVRVLREALAERGTELAHLDIDDIEMVAALLAEARTRGAPRTVGKTLEKS